MLVPVIGKPHSAADDKSQGPQGDEGLEAMLKDGYFLLGHQYGNSCPTCDTLFCLYQSWTTDIIDRCICAVSNAHGITTVGLVALVP